MKRFAALLLLVLLTMMPFSASMADTDNVYIWGVTLNGTTNQYYKNGENGAAGSLVTANDDWNAHYDAADGVLTLRNLNVSGSNSTVLGLDFVYGIYVARAYSSNLTIKLEGNNSVSTADSNSFNLCAVRMNCNLTIQGSGKLTATAGKAVPVATSTSSYGLMAYSITQKSGTVTAYGGEAPYYSSFGVHASQQITVSGGSLTGVGGKSGVNPNVVSVGIMSIGITVSGGSLTGIGGWAKDSARSRGVYSSGYSISSGRLVAKAETGGTPLLMQPNPLPTAYYWRTSESTGYTQFPTQGYVWDAAQTYVDIRTSLPSAGGTGVAGDVGPDVPETGDSATPMLWLGIALLAGAGFAVRRRKRQNG